MTLTLRKFDGRSASFVVVGHMVDPSTHGIAAHQPSLEGLQHFRRLTRISHSGIEPQIVIRLKDARRRLMEGLQQLPVLAGAVLWSRAIPLLVKLVLVLFNDCAIINSYSIGTAGPSPAGRLLPSIQPFSASPNSSWLHQCSRMRPSASMGEALKPSSTSSQ